MSLSKQEFTNAGKSMLGRAQASETLTITKLVVGSGVATSLDQLWPLTALISKKLDVAINSKRDYGDGTMLVEGSFRSDQAAAAFDLRELGVMAHVGTEADRLYSVANVLADLPDHVDPASPTVRAFKVKLVIDRIPAAQVTVTIGPAESITGENIGADTVGKGWYKEAVGNVMRFKRAAEGSGIEITEDAGNNLITIAAKTLKADLDVYVPANHPNCPDPKVGFATVQLAHDYLTQWRIPSSRLARINVWKGTYAEAPKSFYHPDSTQIQLLGWPREDYPITNTQYISANSKRVTLAAAPGAALQNGMIVYLAGAGFYSGGCRISSIAGNVVTCTVLHRSAQAVSNPVTAQANGGRLSRYPTILECNDPNGQNLNFPNGLNLMDKICFHKGMYGIGGGNAGMSNIMVIGGLGSTNRRGVTAGGSLQQIGGESVITDWDFGFTSRSGGALWVRDYTYINACNSGFNPGGGGGAMAALVAGDPNNLLTISHCIMGIQVWTGSSASGGAILLGINDKGIACWYNSIVTVGTGNDQYVLYFQNDIDIEAYGMSMVVDTKNNGSGPTPAKCSPAPELLGNLNSLIHLA